MHRLTDEDMYWLKRRLPAPVHGILRTNKHSAFVAGGFIRSCIAGEEVNDIDIFTATNDQARAISTTLVSRSTGLRMVETDNAFTVVGLTYPVQFIHRWSFDNPQKCVESFDFTIARAAIWYGDEQDSSRHPILSSCCDERFYSDLAAKRLIYCAPIRNEDPGGSMLRVLKFYQRGYRISLDSLGRVMARMTMVVKGADKIDFISPENRFTEEQVGCIYEGMLREVDPDIDPEHLANLPGIQSTQE